MTAMRWLALGVMTAVGALLAYFALRVPPSLQQIALDAARDVGVPESWVAAGSDLWRLLKRESNLNPRAQNPTSTAYGLFQFLDKTWPQYGEPKTDDPRAQFRAGLRYIRARYGDPARAWAFWQAQRPHWY